jgi:hypothetical protein
MDKILSGFELPEVCLCSVKKDICNVLEIREDAATLSITTVFGTAVFM